MIITSEIAQPIVDQMIKVIDYNVNIMNHKGVIVASGNRNRIHQKHQGALEAIALKREKVIYASDIENMLGTIVGVNVPIELNEKIIGVVGVTGEPNKIYRFTHIIKTAVEALLSRELLIDQLKYKQSSLEEWIQNLIDENYNNISLLESKASYFNIDVKQQRVVYLIETTESKTSTNYFKEMQENKERIIRLLKLHFPQSFYPIYLGKGLFIVVFPIPNEIKKSRLVEIGNELYARLKIPEAYIGIGSIDKGILGYRSSYKNALISIEILKRLSTQQKVSQINEWGILQLIIQVPPADRQNYLNQFLNNKPFMEVKLTQTINVFLENNLNIKKTSEDLHIHRNTLIYRLEKIKELWKLDPRNFQDAVNLQLLYWCEKLNNT